MKNKPTKRYLRGKRSYENAMRHWEGKFPAFKELSLKDKRFWWKEEFESTLQMLKSIKNSIPKLTHENNP